MSKIFNLWLMIIFGLLAFGQLQRWQFHPVLAVYLSDLAIWGWVAIHFFLKRNQIHNIKVDKLLIIIIGAGLLNALYHGQNLLIPCLYLIRIASYGWFGLLLKKYLMTAQQRHQVRLWLLATGLLILCFGLIQYLLIPDTRYLAILGWDNHYFRLISTWFDPAFTGLVLVFTFLLLINRQSQNQNLKFLGLALLLTGILLTYSRSSYLALLIGSGYLFITQPKLKPLICWCALLVVVGFYLLPKPMGEGGLLLRTSTITARKSNVFESLGGMKNVDWLIGQGLFTLRELVTQNPGYVTPNHARIPDNMIVFLLTNLGVIGAGTIIFKLAKLAWQAHLTDPVLASCLLSLLVHSQFNASLVQPFILIFMIAIWASTDREKIT